MPIATSRRSLLRGAAAAALALPLSGLYGRRATAMARIEPIGSPYGPIAPVKDQITGLPLLQLPEGFTYQTFGWSGDLMADGNPNPTNHDGMAVITSTVRSGAAELVLIRNHEATVNPLYGTIKAPAFYDKGMMLIGEDADDNPITGPAAGGTTKLVFRRVESGSGVQGSTANDFAAQASEVPQTTVTVPICTSTPRPV